MTKTDNLLAAQYGGYASFSSPGDPDSLDHYGDPHPEEVTRLLDRLITPQSTVLDLGCGAGQRMCAFAPKAAHIWGLDMDEKLLGGARERASTANLSNVTFVHGNSTDPVGVAELPDNAFDLVYTIRGPFINASMLRKIKANGQVVVEWYRDPLGLKEMFGRRPMVSNSAFSGPDICINHHADLGFVPVSVKDYFFDAFYRDEEHLAIYLKSGMTLSNWWMEYRPYDEVRDREALKLYARYNRTERGIRVLGHRKIYLFRREETNRYPVDNSTD